MFSFPQLRNARVVPFNVPRMVWRYHHHRIEELARRAVFTSPTGNAGTTTFDVPLSPLPSVLAPPMTCHGAGCDDGTVPVTLYKFWVLPWFQRRNELEYLEVWPTNEKMVELLGKLEAEYI